MECGVLMSYRESAWSVENSLSDAVYRSLASCPLKTDTGGFLGWQGWWYSIHFQNKMGEEV